MHHFLKTTAIILIALALLGCGQEEILHELPERQANNALAELAQYGIAANKLKEEGVGRSSLWTVTVSVKEAKRALQILRKVGIPSTQRSTCQDLKKGTIPTPEEQRQEHLCRLMGTIENQLETIDGVVNAEVTIALPATQTFRDPDIEAPRPKASVVLRYLQRKQDNRFQEGDIKRIVANGVSELDPKDVTVLMQRVQSASIEPEALFVSFGPLKVARESKQTFQIIALFIILALVFMGLMVVYAFMNMGKTTDTSQAANTMTPSQLPALRDGDQQGLVPTNKQDNE